MANDYRVEKMDMREAKFMCRNYNAKITENYLEIKDGDISLRFSYPLKVGVVDSDYDQYYCFDANTLVKHNKCKVYDKENHICDLKFEYSEKEESFDRNLELEDGKLRIMIPEKNLELTENGLKVIVTDDYSLKPLKESENITYGLCKKSIYAKEILHNEIDDIYIEKTMAEAFKDGDVISLSDEKEAFKDGKKMTAQSVLVPTHFDDGKSLSIYDLVLEEDGKTFIDSCENYIVRNKPIQLMKDNHKELSEEKQKQIVAEHIAQR